MTKATFYLLMGDYRLVSAGGSLYKLFLEQVSLLLMGHIRGKGNTGSHNIFRPTQVKPRPYPLDPSDSFHCLKGACLSRTRVNLCLNGAEALETDFRHWCFQGLGLGVRDWGLMLP